ncbi:hypothetical protein CVT26_010401 [Gymnopilus dilepis]|uniref:Uncharacterized protein n=1 Tax=Gymnopilus dilepis TaxID=231916 RepID=A0A409VZ92_9AGAR|nr:hypothetical protein CVT26_010401 [Gymnopilus dilepis]
MPPSAPIRMRAPTPAVPTELPSTSGNPTSQAPSDPPSGRSLEADVEAKAIASLVEAALKGDLHQSDLITKEKQELSEKYHALVLTRNKKTKTKSELDDFIRHLATLFQFLWSPFITDDHFANLESKPGFLPTSPARYQAENMLKGPLSEFFALLLDGAEPEQQVQLEALVMKDRTLITRFIDRIRDARSSAVDSLRKVFQDLFNLDRALSGHSSEAGEARQQCKRLWKDFLGLDDPEDLGNLKEKLGKMPPIFYKDFDSSKDEAWLKSLHHTRPYFMALYLLCGDAEFTTTGQGNNTKINFLKRLEMYKKFIILAEKTSWYETLISTWEKELFPNRADANGDDVEDELREVAEGGEERANSDDELSGLLGRLQLANRPASNAVPGSQDNAVGVRPSVNASTIDHGNGQKEGDPSEETDEEEGGESSDEPLSNATVCAATHILNVHAENSNRLTTNPLERTSSFIGDDELENIPRPQPRPRPRPSSNAEPSINQTPQSDLIDNPRSATEPQAELVVPKVRKRTAKAVQKAAAHEAALPSHEAAATRQLRSRTAATGSKPSKLGPGGK